MGVGSRQPVRQSGLFYVSSTITTGDLELAERGVNFVRDAKHLWRKMKPIAGIPQSQNGSAAGVTEWQQVKQR